VLRDEQAEASQQHLVWRWMVAFGEFWWDFLVGDTPELVPGVLAILGIAALAVHQGAPRFVVIGAVPVLSALLLCLSVFRRRKSRH
jgi:hypothetical protein